MDSIIKKNFQYELEQIDWDFTGERGANSYLSFHWYPARFVPQIPSILIGYFSDKGDTILDPFCGSGTTLLEAFRLDRKPIGIDIHPAAILMTKAKLLSIEPQEIDAAIQVFTNLAESEACKTAQTDERMLSIPNAEENSKWFAPQTLMELSCIYHEISALGDDKLEMVAKCCFSSILNKVCSQDKHYGWICDNVKPKELVYKDAFVAFKAKLYEYKKFKEQYDIEMKHYADRMVGDNDVQILCGDSRKLLKEFSSDSIDLVVTSPPYLNVTDYVKSFRLYMLWFGPPEWGELSKSEIGARWKRFHKFCLEEYISEMKECVAQITRVLKHDKYFCIVIGESSKHPAYKSKLLSICNNNGFAEVKTLSRKIARQRQLYPSLLQESIVVLQNKKSE